MATTRTYDDAEIPTIANIHKPGAIFEESVQANFHEKALFVKADVAAPFVVERNGSMSFALCFHPHF